MIGFLHEIQDLHIAAPLFLNCQPDPILAQEYRCRGPWSHLFWSLDLRTFFWIRSRWCQWINRLWRQSGHHQWCSFSHCPCTHRRCQPRSRRLGSDALIASLDLDDSQLLSFSPLMPFRDFPQDRLNLTIGNLDLDFTFFNIPWTR